MPLTNPWTAFVDPVLNWSSLAVLSLDQPSTLCRQWQPATIRHNESRLSISPNWSSKKAWKAAQLEEYLWASCYLVSMRAHGSISRIVARSQAAQIRGQHRHSPTLIGCCSIRPCHIPKTQDLGKHLTVTFSVCFWAINFMNRQDYLLIVWRSFVKVKHILQK